MSPRRFTVDQDNVVWILPSFRKRYPQLGKVLQRGFRATPPQERRAWAAALRWWRREIRRLRFELHPEFDDDHE
jgi:hypothetical protein